MKKRSLKERWANAVTVALHALLLMAVYILQGMIFPYLKLSGLVPLLLPVVCTGVAVYQGRIAGGVSGLFAGILCDISFNRPTALFTVVLTLTGISVGYLTDTVLNRRYGTYFLCSAAVLAVVSFVQMFPFLFFEGVSSSILLSTALWQTLYSLVFTFPLSFAVRALGKRAGVMV